MTDIIKLLPDSVANQIAAGEVIQRPASAAKEMLENAVDAGATEIILVVKDAGKTLIQITDNGCGMSETDARLCFERHATSKIREARDLFAIRTMGFRGEALASVAAIAQVELKTKRREDELGTCIHIEGSSVKSQEPCQCSDGTTFAVKNLFYNVPARRNFLKSDLTELGYITEEFQRVALVNPGISMSLFHNGKPVFQLQSENLRKRIISVFGDTYAQRLVNVESETSVLKIHGFICKPEFAKKKRAEQYFFANGRFIRHGYLNHAVEHAFAELLPEGSHPAYYLYLEVDPQTIDINIHPTKTEVKFEDEKSMYMILRAAVKQALGKYSLTPSIDFETEKGLFIPEPDPGKIVKVPQIAINPNFNPFDKPAKTQSRPLARDDARKGLDQWEKLYDTRGVDITVNSAPVVKPSAGMFDPATEAEAEDTPAPLFAQLFRKYVLTQMKSGLMAIHQQYAHERILFERMAASMENENTGIQQQLFPQTLNFTPADAQLLRELNYEIHKAGFDIEEFGANTFVINGAPADLQESDLQGLLERIIDQYRNETEGQKDDRRTRLAVSMAKQMAMKPGRILKTEEMRSLVDQLFACGVPELSPSGKKTFVVVSSEQMDSMFK